MQKKTFPEQKTAYHYSNSKIADAIGGTAEIRTLGVFSMKQKSVFFWINGLDDFIEGRSAVCGILVQMFFWSQAFAAHNWHVSALTFNSVMNHQERKNIHFSLLRTPRFIAPVFELWKILSVVSKRPDLIIVNGATRSLGFIAFFCRIFQVKFALLFASDTDLKPEEELIRRSHDRKLYRWGLRNSRCFVCQNQLQLKLLEENYHLGKFGVIIPNIWPDQIMPEQVERKNILWVANFRELKRPEMFLELADRFPSEHFVMAGGFQTQCFENAKKRAGNISNLEFLGPVSFERSQKLFSEAKLFVCTSSIEGFPNTFLQAFSNGIPLLTTFDPGEIVKKHQLGLTAEDENELQNALQKLLENPEEYKKMSLNAQKFFVQNYSLDKAYQTLVDFIGAA